MKLSLQKFTKVYKSNTDKKRAFQNDDLRVEFKCILNDMDRHQNIILQITEIKYSKLAQHCL